MVLIARHLWEEGTRNFNNKDLAGLFYRCGWTEDETATVIEAVMRLRGDDDKTRIKTLRSTFKKAAAGQKVTAATSLRKRFGGAVDAVVNAIQEWARGPDGGGSFPDIGKDGNPLRTMRNTMAALAELGVECSYTSSSSGTSSPGPKSSRSRVSCPTG